MKNEFRIADIALAPEGRRRIDWAWEYMPVLRLIAEKESADSPLAGLVVGTCLHLEAKTACLLKVLKSLGATVVAAGSNPLSTQDSVCAALAEDGIHVFSRRGMTAEEYTENLREMLDWNPQIIIDDGGDVVSMVIEERRDLIPNLLGGCEETTTGIKRLRAMAQEGVLPFPMLAVNDAQSKHLFDNRYGTGQSVWDAILRTTNLIVAGKNVVISGYGWCGKGTASRAKGLGAKVIVVEIDPHRAIEALMDGFEVMDMRKAAEIGDVFITVTGNTKVIRKEHFEKMKDGVLLCNAGHFDVEVYVPHLKELAKEVRQSRDNVDTYVMADGRRLHLLGEGRLVNLAAGDGHPVEIMDLSFAMQLLSCIYLSKNRLEPGLYNVPDELDKSIGALKLESLGIGLEKLTPEQEAYLASWRE
ncbi:adenosylhomocysteinase [Synergistaceae bacterium OttesenSCG-928-D05]|nr:adenosylhomocysteinase [Synergistaceae bacterium OttesenSCG-928-D05]